MIDPLKASLEIAGAGLDAQSTRLRIISQNIANSQSTASVAGGDPYARQTVSFDSVLDRSTGVDLVRVKSIGVDESPFKLELDPGNPAADASLIELADMREANRTYEANLQVAKQSADMMNQTVSLLKDA